ARASSIGGTSISSASQTRIWSTATLNTSRSAGFVPYEDLTALYAGLRKPTRNIGPVAHQPPDLWKSAMSYCHMTFEWFSEAIANAVGGKRISYVGGTLCLCLLIQASNGCCDRAC